MEDNKSDVFTIHRRSMQAKRLGHRIRIAGLGMAKTGVYVCGCYVYPQTESSGGQREDEKET